MTSPIVCTEEVEIRPGPALLCDALDPVGHLAEHRRRHGSLPELDLDALLAITGVTRLRGRGGAGFPFARKLRAAADNRGLWRRAIVVVNAAEGEPGSSKDAALARTNPHLALDGAAVAARALGTREIHVVVPGDRPAARAALEDAVTERDDAGLRWSARVAAPRFVSGQSRAVVELLAGRPGLPVTAREPEAVSGLRGRPTLLSNLETWAQVGVLALEGADPTLARGTTTDPGTVLLTVHLPERSPTVLEVQYGAGLADLLADLHGGRVDGPVLLGGFHGTWAAAAGDLRIAPAQLRARGLALGAGIVVVPDRCPLELTADIVAHLSLESAGRCGPCLNGLPALARALGGLVDGDVDALDEVQRLGALVTGRGACAHPDGTARLVESFLVAVPDEVAAHLGGHCTGRPGATAAGVVVPTPRADVWTPRRETVER